MSRYPECPACARQAEAGPWPDHAPGCPDAPEAEDAAWREQTDDYAHDEDEEEEDA